MLYAFLLLRLWEHWQRTIRIGKLRSQGPIAASLWDRTSLWTAQNVRDVLTLWTHGILEFDDMLPVPRSNDFVYPSQIIRIHFLITGIVRLICIQNVRCRVQVLATFLRIYNCLSCLTSNRPSPIMSVMWLLSLVLQQVSLGKRTWNIFMLLHVYILSSEEDLLII